MANEPGLRELIAKWRVTAAKSATLGEIGNAQSIAIESCADELEAALAEWQPEITVTAGALPGIAPPSWTESAWQEQEFDLPAKEVAAGKATAGVDAQSKVVAPARSSSETGAQEREKRFLEDVLSHLNFEHNTSQQEELWAARTLIELQLENITREDRQS